MKTPRSAACLLALALLAANLTQAQANPPLQHRPPAKPAGLAAAARHRPQAGRSQTPTQSSADDTTARATPTPIAPASPAVRSISAFNNLPAGLARPSATPLTVAPSANGTVPAANVTRHHRSRVVFYLSVQPAYAAWQPEANLLREAYVALSLADHDYDGHRFGAMRQTALAGEIVGIHLRGDGDGEETQAESDAHLRDARGYLAQALPLAGNAANGQLAAYIQQAIAQIDTGLELE